MRSAVKNNLIFWFFVLVVTVISSLLSWFFSLLGANMGDIYLMPVARWSNHAWSVWGISWGGACGILGGYFLLGALIKTRKLMTGAYGSCIGLAIGSLNGFLSNTMIFGIIEGLVLGSIGGLVLSSIFLAVYDKGTSIKKI